MHPKLLLWLTQFEEACDKEANHPTKIYNHLVQLGIDTPSYCDCLETIAEQQKHIRNSVDDLGSGMFNSPEAKSSKLAYIRFCQEDIDFQTSVHTSHVEFNTRVHEILKSRELLKKVRSVCLRDLRTFREPSDDMGGPQYCRIALRSYGERLKSFLTNNQRGWF